MRPQFQGEISWKLMGGGLQEYHRSGALVGDERKQATGARACLFCGVDFDCYVVPGSLRVFFCALFFGGAHAFFVVVVNRQRFILWRNLTPLPRLRLRLLVVLHRCSKNE